MQRLVERKLHEELGGEKDVNILGKEITEIPRSHEEARALGEKLGAAMVLWGEVLMLHGEVEIQPYMTAVKTARRGEKEATLKALQANLAEPNQMNLRKGKAVEVGNMALLAVGRYYRNSDPARSLALFEKINPPVPESLRAKAWIFFSKYDFAGAQKAFEAAKSLDEDNILTSFGLAMTRLFFSGHSEDLLKEFQSLGDAFAKTDPAMAALCMENVAKIQSLSGRHEEALALYRRLADKYPHDPEMRNAAAYLLMWLGDLDDALE